MSVQHGDHPLDGNAAGGRLRELFALDVTAAEIVCGGCGAAAAIGAVRDYGGSMGAILRCAHCDTVLLRLTHTPAGLWLDMRGARRMFIAAPEA
ncbi:MAG: DUF6510 family protein [Pseudolabrys sp.]